MELERQLRMKVQNDPLGRTYFQLLIEAMIKRGVAKSDSLVCEIFNRIEGRQNFIVDDDEDGAKRGISVVIVDIPRPENKMLPALDVAARRDDEEED